MFLSRSFSRRSYPAELLLSNVYHCRLEIFNAIKVASQAATENEDDDKEKGIFKLSPKLFAA